MGDHDVAIVKTLLLLNCLLVLNEGDRVDKVYKSICPLRTKYVHKIVNDKYTYF